MHLSEYVYTVLLKPAPLRRAANALIKATLPRTVSVGGSTICINPDDPVISGALALHVYEKAEIAFFRRHFRADMTFVDVGANVGLYTGLALATPDFSATVVAVEPHGESRRFLQQTIAANNHAGRGRVFVVPVAASNRSGSVKLFKNEGNKGDNRIYADSLLTEAESIEAETLDRICAAQGVHSAQFVKIDVQGAEPKVLAGATTLLENSRDCILMTEFWPYGIARCGEDARDYFASLVRLGFCMYELDEHTLRLVPVPSGDELVRRNPGRHYTNLIGLKGQSVALARSASQ